MQIDFATLYTIYGLHSIDRRFLAFLQDIKPDAYNLLLAYRANKSYNADVVVELAKYLETFLIEIFDLKDTIIFLNDNPDEKLIWVKRNFIIKNAIKKYPNPDDSFEQEYNFQDEETLIDEVINQEILELPEDEGLLKYVAWASLTNKGRRKHINSNLFNIPRKIDPKNMLIYNDLNTQERLGFDYSGRLINEAQALWEAGYCLHCHKRDKDSCRKGLSEDLHGCPLDQKISEMLMLKHQKWVIAPLAVAMIDNPLIAATGDRICNDCSKACIYQKQDPVDIPATETKIFQDVLDLPFGLEIYSLLMRWNPLKHTDFLPSDELSGRNVLVAGLGPAGFGVAYYMLMKGANVVAVDGLKIDKLEVQKNYLIKNVSDILKPLSDIPYNGFGGVMDYGITVRWNKGYLLIIRLILERFANFQMYGCVRFGEFFAPKDAFEMGFHHIALCIGTGKPNTISQLISVKGVILASDFLMNLHLNKPFKNNSTGKLDFGQPVVVIGGGLTAVDSACEAKAYIEYISKKPAKVMLVYRKSIQESPAYKINHKELQEAIKQGIEIIDNFDIADIITEADGHIKAIRGKNGHILEAKSIIVAVGTHANTRPLEEVGLDAKKLTNGFFIDKQISIHGDLHSQYSGSVVRALASAKNSADPLTQSLLRHNSKPLFIPNFTSKVTNITEIDGIFKISIESPFNAIKAKPLQIFRLQVNGFSKPIPITLAFKTDSLLVFYIEKAGRSSESILKNQTEVHLMAGIMPLSSDNISKIKAKGKRQQLIAKDIASFYNFDYEVSAKEGIFVEFKNQTITKQTTQEMQCMLGGVCGRCFTNGKFMCANGFCES